MADTFKLSKKLEMPQAILSQHMAVLGKTRSGKSSVMRLFVESLLDRGERVCVIDPKGDWWGLKSSGTGRSAGYPVVLFGGANADVPLNDQAGASVAELVATGNRPCVIDMGGWQVAERTRFFIDFAKTIFQKMQGRIWLVIDEVHNFAPQGKVLDPQAGQQLHWANRLASEGAGRGIVILSASQRPQKVHKDFLTCAETLVAMRVIHPLDRRAIAEWIDGCPDRDKGRQVLESLASMKRGEGWVWSPEIAYGPQRVQFPMFNTYDSFAAPTATGGTPVYGWADVDLDEVREKLAKVVSDAKQNDPKELRRQIAELQKKLDTTGNAKVIRDATAAEAEKWLPLVDQWQEVAGTYQKRCNLLYGAVTKAHAELARVMELVSGNSPVDPKMNATRYPSAVISEPPQRSRVVKSPTHSPEIPASLKTAEFRVLRALFWLKDEETTPDKVAFYANYTVNGHFNNTLGQLRSAGLVAGWQITTNGIAALGDGVEEKPTGPELREWLREKLSAPHNKLLDVLMDAQGAPVAVTELAYRAGYTINGHFNNVLGKLRTLNIAQGGARDGVRANAVFFRV